MTTFSLYELLQTVSLVITDALPDRYWVRAEVSSISAREGGHCYIELVEEQGEARDSRTARIRANCWRQTWAQVSRRFVEVTGGGLKQGMQILVEVSVTMHPQYGLSLNIHDIDPTFSLGDIARRRQDNLRRLEENGLTTRQQQLRLATLPQRIAVVSSSTAAGYQDFVHQLTQSHFATAIMFQSLLMTTMPLTP